MNEQKDTLWSVKGLLGLGKEEVMKGKRKDSDVSFKIMCLDCMYRANITSFAHKFELNESYECSYKKRKLLSEAEEVLYTWIQDMNKKDLPVIGPLIMEKATFFL